MRTVYKYPVPIGEETRVEVPGGGRVVHVAVDVDAPRTMLVWVEVGDTAADPVPRVFAVYGTGEPIDADAVHRGTDRYPYPGGLGVWHVYERSP